MGGGGGGGGPTLKACTLQQYDDNYERYCIRLHNHTAVYYMYMYM